MCFVESVPDFVWASVNLSEIFLFLYLNFNVYSLAGHRPHFGRCVLAKHGARVHSTAALLLGSREWTTILTRTVEKGKGAFHCGSPLF